MVLLKQLLMEYTDHSACSAMQYFPILKLGERFQAKHSQNKSAENDLNSLIAKRARYCIQGRLPKLGFV